MASEMDNGFQVKSDFSSPLGCLRKHYFTMSLPLLVVKIHFYTTKKLELRNFQLDASSEIKLL